MGSIGEAATSYSHSPQDLGADDTITTDICVIGGGAAGTYTAMRVKDLGYSVTLVEKNDRLGGHAENYYHTESDQTLDVGVIVFGHTEEVRRTFERFGIALKVAPVTINTPDYVDFETGETAPFQAPSAEAMTTAMGRYAIEVMKYPELQTGFDLPDPIPDDLMLPFGDFIKKHQLEDLAPAIFAYCHGYLPLLELSTIYVLKYFNMELINTLSKGFLMTENNNVGTLYERAGEYLGTSSVLLGSTVIQVNRSQSSEDFVRVLVSTVHGTKLIKARRVVSAIPHNIKNLKGWDLSEEECRLFSQFKYSAYYAGVVKGTGLTQHNPIHAYGKEIGYGIPKLPSLYAINPSKIPGFYQWYYGSPHALTKDEVSARVTSSIRKVQKARGIDSGGENGNIEIVKFADHTPFNHTVSAEIIRTGFYRDLMNLQGKRQTYYHGAAFHTQDTTLLWRLTESLLPRILTGVVKTQASAS